MIARPTPLRRFIEEQLRTTACDDAAGRARLRDLFSISLGLGIAGLAAFPGWLAFGAGGSVLAAITFAWMLAPIGVALYVARSGNLAGGHLLFAVCGTGLVAWLAALTGGLGSPFLLSLALVPLVAAGSEDRVIVIRAMAAVGVGVAVLCAITLGGLGLPGLELPAAASAVVVAFTILLVGLRILFLSRQWRTGSVAAAEEDTIATLAESHAKEMLSLHGASGSVERLLRAPPGIAGAAPAELCGDGLFRRIVLGDRPRYLTALSDALRGRPTTAEYRLAAGQDESAWVETAFHPLRTGANAKAVGVTRRIDDRKALEAAAEAARAGADTANAAKSRFLAHISHELRTPLNSIVGFSEILANDQLIPFDRNRWRDYARLIGASGAHLLQIVNDLLDVSKIEAGRFSIHRTSVAVGPLVEECLLSLHPQAAERSMTIEAEIDDDLPEIDADRRACRQILVNLLSNAVKFSHAGGTVTVAARAEGNVLHLSVVDRGIGIAASDLPQLGAPFFQADSAYNRRYEGTGLGLSVVKGLVALHGGDLAIRSEAGAGTTVDVALPIASVTAQPPSSGTVDLYGKERRSA